MPARETFPTRVTPVSQDRYNVLFLCTANSARSIFAESIMNHVGGHRFRAYSAGSQPSGEVNPDAIRLLEKMKLPTKGLRSKDWDEFAAPDAPKMDFVFTVCDRAAGQTCPVWPGQPMTAHWGMEDPAQADGDDEHRLKAFRTVFFGLQSRIHLFINLPLKSLGRLSLQTELDQIGRHQSETPS